ncbi:MAG: methyltransferase domain-containing protein [Elusimicrobia bacterium]|nr:methyltransferase domain-containing protein [Elusimicrobiota bacterium]
MSAVSDIPQTKGWRLSPGATQALRCPACRCGLEFQDDEISCTGPSCGKVYPVVDGIPVLIDDVGSVFSLNDFTARRGTFYQSSETGARQSISRLLPSLGDNLKAKGNFLRFAGLLRRSTASPKVLVVGGSRVGPGLESILSDPQIDFVESDVALGQRTALICDAHGLPFDDETFDAVVAQVVLEHVVDPYACVEEMRRILKPGGLVYAETPFMEQVHAGRYDFTRFTRLGHRRLFRGFEEISSGIVGGPGMALAWSYRYFLLSFAESRRLRTLLSAFARLTAFWLKYFDPYLTSKAGALDAAAEFYFMGRKSDRLLADRELIRSYKGLMDQ